MDPLSVTASIIAILQLSAKVLSYLNDVKDASKDRITCAVEASNLHNLLFNLRFRLEEGDLNRPWYVAVRALAVEHGPLDQFKQALEMLQARMTDGGRLKKAGESLMWKFKKEDAGRDRVADGPLVSFHNDNAEQHSLYIQANFRKLSKTTPTSFGRMYPSSSQG